MADASRDLTRARPGTIFPTRANRGETARLARDDHPYERRLGPRRARVAARSGCFRSRRGEPYVGRDQSGDILPAQLPQWRHRFFGDVAGHWPRPGGTMTPGEELPGSARAAIRWRPVPQGDTPDVRGVSCVDSCRASHDDAEPTSASLAAARRLPHGVAMPRHYRLPLLAAVAACALAGCSQTPAPVSIPPAASSPATPAAAQPSESSAPGSTTPTPPIPGASAGGVAGAAHQCRGDERVGLASGALRVGHGG